MITWRTTARLLLQPAFLLSALACSDDVGPIGPSAPPIEGVQVAASPYIGDDAVIVITNDSEIAANYLICGRLLERRNGDSWDPAPVQPRVCQLLGQVVLPGRTASHVVEVDEEIESGAIYRYRLDFQTRERYFVQVSNAFRFD